MVSKRWVTSAVGAHARSRGRGFAAGVAATDDDDVERFLRGAHAGFYREAAKPGRGKLRRRVVSRETAEFREPKLFHVKQSGSNETK